ncbi:DUF11 domain-containing protein [Diaminobutyricimonas aerilata]|uniref:DUF7927 domain-containing protein n=1 Tax=Diaminobutyricimonas aerilata TaxID=1162967 RepID=UPI0014736A81|nr:DUF11 domain-containing protein [Diaminobutyricimonas aerilata]
MLRSIRRSIRRVGRGWKASVATVVAVGLVATGAPLSASAAIVANHEITVNWIGNTTGAPVPTSAPFASTVTAEWHINTNDASDPFSKEPVDNVRATLTAGNARFTSIPAVCKTSGVTPVSSISADGATLLCNLGTLTSGSANIFQTPMRVTGSNGGNVTVSGTVISDSAAAASAPAAPTPLPITYTYGLDLALGAGSAQGVVLPSRTGGNRTFVDMNFSIILAGGSRPGPVNYSFPVTVASNVAGGMTGFQFEGCVPTGDATRVTGHPFSDPAKADRANFPGCTVAGTGANYTVNLSGLDYTLTRVPVNDSFGQPLGGTGAYIASGTVRFSIPNPVTVITEYSFNATNAGNVTFVDGTVRAEAPKTNNVTTATLRPPGGYSVFWAGQPAASRGPWDTNLWVSPGTSQDQVANLRSGVAAAPLPLYFQTNSSLWSGYSGAGGAQLGGLCLMNQNPAFVLTGFDGGGWGDVPGSYDDYASARYYYTTAPVNTKTETCGQAAPSAMWVEVQRPAGSTLTHPTLANASVITGLPAGVTAIKMTWNPGIDRTPPNGLEFLRGFGYISPTAPTSGEGWVTGAFTAKPESQGSWPTYPALNGWHNVSTGPGGTNLPGSTYGPNMNGARDAYRLQGPNGVISKVASTTTATAGQPITYTVKAQARNAIVNPPPVTFSVVDTLPAGLVYVAGSATPAPTSVSADRRTLTWNFPNAQPNVERTITYQGEIDAAAPPAPGASLTNSAVVNVPGDQSLPGARTASATVVVPNSASTSFGKSADDNVLSFYGDSSAWTLNVDSQDPVSNPYTDTIDILPSPSDGRGTNADGGYTVTGVTAPAGATVYYSIAPFGSLSDDPRSASNGGTPGSVTGNTVGWTTVRPTVVNPTAIRVIGPALAPGARQTIKINFTTPAGTNCAAPAAGDNKPGQVLVNSGNSYAGHTRLPMRASATTTIGDCYALDLKKYVLTAGGDPQNPADYVDANAVAEFPQYAEGATVPFRFVLSNKGTGTLTNIVVSDPLAPSCATTVATLAGGAESVIQCSMTAGLGTTINTATATVTPPEGPQLTPSDPAGFVVPLPYTIAKSSTPASGSAVLPGDEITYSVTVTEPADSPAPWRNPAFTDDLAAVLDDADLVGDPVITTSVDGAPLGTASVNGTVLSWTAPLIAPGQTYTISYTVEVNGDGDDVLRNVVTPPTGIECDPCSTEHLIPGIQFEKTSDVATARAGDVVTYTVTARNTGQVAYTVPGYPASVSDPLTDVLVDADLVAGSATNGATFDGDSVDWTGALAVGGETSFSFQVRIKNPNPGDDRLVNRIVSETPGNNCDADSTDPLCDATVLVQSYTVEKSTAETPVVRGDVVSYSLTIRNTGQVPYTGVGADVASFSDDLADVLDDADFTGTATGGAVLTGTNLTWSGSLGVGQSRTFTYTVTVKQTPNAASQVLNNTVTPTGPGGSCAEAGACDTSTPIAQFRVEKTADPAYTNPGGTVSYTIVVTNTGQVPFTDAYPASFRDSFAGIVDDGQLVGLDDDGDIIPGTVTWTAGDATYSGSVLAWEGPLPLGGTVTIEYDVLVDNPDRGDHQLINTITTPPGLANCDTGSTDPACGTNTPVQSYELIKTADTKVAEVGDTVEYTITVRNTGRVPYPAGAGEPQASIADPIGDVLQNASFDGTVTSSTGTADFDDATDTITWVGDLPVDGAPVTITYSVEITSVVTPPDRMVNRAQTTAVGGNCDPATDIDDADPRCQVEIPTRSYEVVKTVSDPIVEPGQQDVTYTISITNTGAEDYTGTGAEAAQIIDDLTDILGDSGGLQVTAEPDGWVVDVVDGVLTATGPLAVEETVELEYTVDIDDPDAGDHRMENRVVTPPGRGGNCTPFSTDEDCDALVLVREYTTEKTVTPEVVEVGDTVVYTVTVRNTGHVAYDGATPDTSASLTDDLSDVLDDATFGTVLQGGATVANGVLTWSGALPIDGVHVIRYTVIATGADESILVNGVTPTGPGGSCVDDESCDTEVRIRSFEYEKSVDAEAATEGQELTYTITVRNTGAVEYTDDVPADIADDLSGVLDDAGELSDPVISPAGAGEATVVGSSILWEGPLALPGEAGDEVTITYTVTVDDPDVGDHRLVNTVTSENGVCAADGVCTTDTPVRSYLVEKSATPGSTLPGGIVEYTITVTNTGTVAFTDADPASIVDDLSDVLDVAGNPTDLAVAGDSDNLPTFAAGELRWSGELPVDGVVTLTYRVQVDAPLAAGADYLLENVVEPTAPGGECGICATNTPIRAYDTVKTVSQTQAEPGDTITYEVTVTNIGQVAYAAPLQATFTDDLADVLDDATGPLGLSAGATFDAATGVISWAGDLPIGGTTTIEYSVVVSDPRTSDGDAILENAVLTAPEGGCAAATVPDCKTVTPVRSLHYTKTVSDEVALQGDVIEYEITVENTGAVDFTAGTPASFDDSLTRILDDVDPVTEESLALDSSAGQASYDETLRAIHWEGPLAAGVTATVTYQVQIANPNLGDNRLDNRIVTPPGTPSNCAADSTDPDCATETLVRSFRIEKSADKTEVVAGEVVEYTIVLTNTGEVAYDDATPVVWTDPLTDVLDDAVYNDDATGGVTWDGIDTLAWTGPLAVDQVIEYTYTVTVRDPIPGDKVLYNRVTSPTIGSNCTDTSDDPSCDVTTGGPSVAVVKTSSTEVALPGDTVEYEITMTNDGGLDWTEERPASFTDSLSAVLDDAVYNGDVRATIDGDEVDGAAVSGGTLSWSGPLERGAAVVVTYTVTINAPVTGDGILDNVVSTPDEVPSNCSAASTDPDCATRTLVRSYIATKTSDAQGTVKPGDRVTYTVTVVNNGQVEYTDEQPATFVDDFSRVLDDATYAGDAPAGTTYAAPTLTWSGALAVGDISLITYSFVVNENGGDNRMLNTVLPDSEIGGWCLADGRCDTALEIVRPLAATGAVVLPIAGGVLALLGAGALLFWFGRRRSSSKLAG